MWLASHAREIFTYLNSSTLKIDAYDTICKLYSIKKNKF